MKILEFLRENTQFGSVEPEEKSFADRVVQLFLDNDDDYYDAARDFKSIYGYDPVERRGVSAPRDQGYAKKLRKPKMVGGFFYRVPNADHQTAISIGLHQTKSGKWMIPVYTNQNDPQIQATKQQADAVYGDGKWWTPKR